ncbi:MAG: metallophosphoesterase family protein [Planctomycetales bacterium]|nr:metallophosphoesterase family protein [Planctomycetales bacterium]
MASSICYRRVALLGGVYSNYLALHAALADITARGVDGIFCLGDLGAFGPFPDRVFPLLAEYDVGCIQGNYDDSVGHQRDNCQCGYTDPRDNHFAAISYHYTLANTAAANRAYLRELPKSAEIVLGTHRVLLCHGSPRRTNEFLWESTTSSGFLAYLCETYGVDSIAATHTGICWQRRVKCTDREALFVNVGVLGRPQNDGTTNVWYTLLQVNDDGQLEAHFVPVHYDYARLAEEMEGEGLPDEFAATIRTGWWTTCLEILPSRERRRGRW